MGTRPRFSILAFASVLGIDLTPPVKPADAPDNCRSEKANVEQDLLFVHDDEKFRFDSCSNAG